MSEVPRRSSGSYHGYQRVIRSLTIGDMARLASIFCASVILSAGLVAVARTIAQRLRFVDRPNSNTRNAGGGALGGGVAIVASILLMIWLSADFSGSLFRIAFAITGMCALGLVDDIVGLSPLVKVLGQAVCAGIYVFAGQASLGAAIVIVPFLILCSNSWNVVDVMDSLLTTIGAISMAGIGVVMLLHGADARGLPVPPIIVSGVLLGFLIWNRPPARIIMGDAGSLPLGMLFGILVIESFRDSALLASAVVLPGLIPLFEVGFLIVQRSLKGVPFYCSTPDHFALRMLHNGYTIAQILRPVILTGVGLAILPCLLVLTSFHPVVAVASVALLVVACVLAYRFFTRLRVELTSR